MSVTIKKRLFFIALLLGVVSLMWFVLVAHSAGSTFACGSGQNKLELTISSFVRYNNLPYPSSSWALKNLIPTTDRFFNFGDVKPGDTAQHRIGIRVEKNPAYVCLDFKNLTDYENGINDPESLVDNTPEQGELSETVYFFAWRDNDGDNVFDVGETPLFGNTPQSAHSVLNKKSYALADMSTGTSYNKNTTHFIGIAWCVGDMSVQIQTAEIHCNGEAVGNKVQTDSMSFDVSLRAVSKTEQPKFYCNPQSKPLPHGQCPFGFKKIVDDYKKGLSWKATSAYSAVVLVGGPPNDNNKDPDGRNKYFYDVRKGATLSREAHEISHICASTEGFYTQRFLDVKKIVHNATPPKQEWKQVTPTPTNAFMGVGKGVLKKLGL